MKKTKFLLFAFVAFIMLAVNVKAVTLPELRGTQINYSEGEYFNDSVAADVPVGQQLQLYAITTHGNDIELPDTPIGNYVDEVITSGVTWSSSNNSIATVDSKGMVTGVSKGKVTINLSYNGQSAKIDVEVTSEECVICAGCGSYNIIFITNSDKAISNMSICKTCGDSAKPVTLPTPEKEGYRFLGWYKDAEFTRPADSSLPSQVGDYVDDGCYDSETAIYAKWQSENECPICVGCGGYEINFETNGGNKIPSMSICKTCGDSTNPVTLPTPEKKGYVFAGWYKDEKLTQKVEIDVPSKIGNYIDSGCYDSKTTVYAKWKNEADVEQVSSSDPTVEPTTDTTTEPKTDPTITTEDDPSVEPITESTDNKNVVEEKKESNNLVIITIIVIVAVLAAAGSIIMIKSKKNTNEN